MLFLKIELKEPLKLVLLGQYQVMQKKPADAKIKSGKYIKKPTEDYDDKS